MGGGLDDSQVVKGMVFSKEPAGIIKKVQNAKVAVFSCPIDISQTETKGTVLLHNAKEMLEFSKGEEQQLEKASSPLVFTFLIPFVGWFRLSRRLQILVFALLSQANRSVNLHYTISIDTPFSLSKFSRNSISVEFVASSAQPLWLDSVLQCLMKWASSIPFK